MNTTRAITGGESKPDGLKDGGNWIGDLHKGGLHQSLHVPAGEKIPEKRIKKAENSRNPKVRNQAIAAETLKHLRPH
jgi:hypothetical protein